MRPPSERTYAWRTRPGKHLAEGTARRLAVVVTTLVVLVACGQPLEDASTSLFGSAPAPGSALQPSADVDEEQSASGPDAPLRVVTSSTAQAQPAPAPSSPDGALEEVSGPDGVGPDGVGPERAVPDSAAPSVPHGPPSDLLTLTQIDRVTSSKITPKSIVYSGDGLFFAQNMMYRHSITVYDRDANLVATISDRFDPADFGLGPSGLLQGAPVEADFTSDGRFAYISNYRMYGPGYSNAGSDSCGNGTWDQSFLYRVNTDSLTIDQVIAVGAVPKFVAVTPDDAHVLVTNWCGYDMSVVDTDSGNEVRRVRLGRHPRGIAVSSDSNTAYVAVMGSRDIAVVSLENFTVEWIRDVGANPRHLVLSADDATLYATMNGDGIVAKIDVASGNVLERVRTGQAPRSMVLSADERSLYVVNYVSDTVAKVAVDSFDVIQTLAVADKPIGITFDPLTRQVWVSSYSGVITVFADRP